MKDSEDARQRSIDTSKYKMRIGLTNFKLNCFLELQLSSRNNFLERQIFQKDFLDFLNLF